MAWESIMSAADHSRRVGWLWFLARAEADRRYYDEETGTWCATPDEAFVAGAQWGASYGQDIAAERVARQLAETTLMSVGDAYRVVATAIAVAAAPSDDPLAHRTVGAVPVDKRPRAEATTEWGVRDARGCITRCGSQVEAIGRAVLFDRAVIRRTVTRWTEVEPL